MWLVNAMHFTPNYAHIHCLVSSSAQQTMFFKWFNFFSHMEKFNEILPVLYKLLFQLLFNQQTLSVTKKNKNQVGEGVLSGKFWCRLVYINIYLCWCWESNFQVTLIQEPWLSCGRVIICINKNEKIKINSWWKYISILCFFVITEHAFYM